MTTEELEARVAALEGENARLRSGAPAGDGPVVKLAGKSIALVKPSSLGRRWHVVMNLVRPGREDTAAWAALGLCWPDFQRRHPYLGDLVAFGSKVADVLLEEGVPFDELSAAASVAARFVQEGLAPVEKADDFSGTRAGGSEPGDESSASSS